MPKFAPSPATGCWSRTDDINTYKRGMTSACVRRCVCLPIWAGCLQEHIIYIILPLDDDRIHTHLVQHSACIAREVSSNYSKRINRKCCFCPVTNTRLVPANVACLDGKCSKPQVHTIDMLFQRTWHISQSHLFASCQQHNSCWCVTWYVPLQFSSVLSMKTSCRVV